MTHRPQCCHLLVANDKGSKYYTHDSLRLRGGRGDACLRIKRLARSRRSDGLVDLAASGSFSDRLPHTAREPELRPRPKEVDSEGVNQSFVWFEAKVQG